jgi:hypothetical protein
MSKSHIERTIEELQESADALKSKIDAKEDHVVELEAYRLMLHDLHAALVGEDKIAMASIRLSPAVPPPPKSASRRRS